MQRLFDVKKTQLQLVQDRGYIVTPQEEAIFTMSLNQFASYVTQIAATFKSSNREALSRVYNSHIVNRKMLVYYAGKETNTKMIPKTVTLRFLELIQQQQVSEAILIIDAPMGTQAKEELNSLTLVKWQIFDDSNLTFNPTLHVDTPRHELLSAEETTRILKEMKVDISKMPIIKLTDPIVQYYGWPVGGLVRLHRNDRAVSILTARSINYRVIVG